MDKIKEKAPKAYFSLISKSREWGGFQPRLFLYLFDHTIVPILKHASEVWGFEEWSVLETLHLKACKYVLSVKSTTNTDAVYSELGRVSLQKYQHVKILKFYSRLCNLETNRYASKAFNMLLYDAESNKVNWVSKARNLQSIYEFQNSDNNEIIKYKVRENFATEIRNKLNIHISEDKKLKLYASFKSSFKFECYLDLISDFNIRSALAKLRLSAHNLHIETGRFNKNKTPRNERFCLYCKKQSSLEVEDEIHFLMVCPLYKTERSNMLQAIYRTFPNTEVLSNEIMFFWLMSQEQGDFIKLIGKFCKKSFQIRKKFLSSPNSTIDLG